MSSNSKQTMNGHKGNADPARRKARRRLIQALAVGGGVASSKLVPGAWQSPMVKSALLPAHAVTSGCVLGNNTIRPLLRRGVEIEPTGETSVAQHVISALIPEAQAGEEMQVLLYELTGCFRIVFPCNSDRGTLYATAIDVSYDGAPDDAIMEIQAPFVSGQNGEIGGYCFKVTLMGGGTYAELRINIDCNDLYDREPIDLHQNFNCEPLLGDN